MGGAPRILEKTSRGGIEMAYPKEKIDEVLAYLDEGHSARDAERRFGVSRERGQVEEGARRNNLRSRRPRPIKYPFETVSSRARPSYGGHGLQARRGRDARRVAPPSQRWEKQGYVGERRWISRDRSPTRSSPRQERDGRDERRGAQALRARVEVKAYVLEGTVKV